MTKLLAVLLCLFLCGCASDPSPAQTDAAMQPEYSGIMEEARISLEERCSGRVQAFPLQIRKVQGMRSMGKELLLLSGYGSTTLTVLSGQTLTEIASITLEFELDAQDPSLQISDSGLSFFDPIHGETVVLSNTLEELRRIPAPPGLVGTPIFSTDQNTLYYCTSDALRELNLDTNIRRRIKQMAYGRQALTGLHLEGTVLQCQVSDGEETSTLFLDSSTGKQLHQHHGELSLTTAGTAFYASFPRGTMQSLVFGESGGEARALLPEDLTAKCTFLPERQTAVTTTITDSGIRLDCYDLETGIRQDMLELEELHTPSGIAAVDGSEILLLIYDPEFDCNAILRWEVSEIDSAPSCEVYTDSYYTAAKPNSAGLSACRDYAEQIGSRYGIEVLIWKDAAAVTPWDYDLEAEHLYRVIMEELVLLDQRLSQYPEELLAQTAAHFDSLKICLVRQIQGSAASGSLDTATGIQFMEEKGAYIVLAAGPYSQQALYHELFHVMETHILTHSTALDQWNRLNPAGFSYDYDYSSNSLRNSGIYLQQDYRAFVDTYSMSFPKEDRARIMEYAMLRGNEALFQTEIMQAKLNAICQGIREAYGLKTSPECFLWEQYLEKPMAYTG